MILPKVKIKAEIKDPKRLVIFGMPKCGKTTALSQLENNLILDFESGTDFVDALKVRVETMADLKDVLKSIKEAEYPYKFITIDTVTALQTFAKPMALNLYKASQTYTEKNGICTDVLTLPMGAGYAFMKTAIEKIIESISKCAPNVILVCHVKTGALADDLDGQLKDLDLAKGLKNAIAVTSDVIGYVSRSEDVLTINFGLDGEVICGSRIPSLSGKSIVLTERLENGELSSNWDQIYVSLKEK